MDPVIAPIAALPRPLDRSLGIVAGLVRPYGLDLQLIHSDGQVVPVDGHRPEPPSDTSAPLLTLTVGEHRIALMVATGATNREVARALWVSPKTVEAHLTHIYQKTGLRSRTELSYTVATAGRPVEAA